MEYIVLMPLLPQHRNRVTEASNVWGGNSRLAEPGSVRINYPQFVSGGSFTCGDGNARIRSPGPQSGSLSL